MSWLTGGHDVIVLLLCCLNTTGSGSEKKKTKNQRELQKQVSEYVSCLQTAGLIIATNYKNLHHCHCCVGAGGK